jgi:hypothetical protein
VTAILGCPNELNAGAFPTVSEYDDDAVQPGKTVTTAPAVRRRSACRALTPRTRVTS